MQCQSYVCCSVAVFRCVPLFECCKFDSVSMLLPMTKQCFCEFPPCFFRKFNFFVSCLGELYLQHPLQVNFCQSCQLMSEGCTKMPIESYVTSSVTLTSTILQLYILVRKQMTIVCHLEQLNHLNWYFLSNKTQHPRAAFLNVRKFWSSMFNTA